MSSLFAERILLDAGWANDVRVDIDDGVITDITVGAPPGDAPRAAGPVVPGMPNLHGHAFQRAMAGLAEHRRSDDDSFWTWRETMYRLVERLEPEDMAAIAAQLDVELLRGGFTATAEFHYLHHQRDGTPYADATTTSTAVIEAARRVGIRTTHLPVAYERGGFDGAPLGDGQRRFWADAALIGELHEALRQRFSAEPTVRIGLALHSLRAVTPATLRVAAATVTDAPIHIHAAEQTLEVGDCVAATGQRPVEWLLEHGGLAPHWCVVHATHLTEAEVHGLAGSGAVAGLCPTTEANLGDGLFPLLDYLEADGRYGVGTDSHVGRRAAAELRWLEYGQRLLHRRRNLVVATGRASVGGSLWDAAARGGAQALGQPIGRLALGRRADLVVLDDDHVALAGLDGDGLLDAWLFGGADDLVRDVMVEGRWVVRDRHHAQEDVIERDYRRVIAALRSA
ncbi:MAG: formimidoylglutamate deiminase [Planctomycetota bacterium]